MTLISERFKYTDDLFSICSSPHFYNLWLLSEQKDKSTLSSSGSTLQLCSLALHGQLPSTDSFRPSSSCTVLGLHLSRTTVTKMQVPLSASASVPELSPAAYRYGTQCDFSLTFVKHTQTEMNTWIDLKPITTIHLCIHVIFPGNRISVSNQDLTNYLKPVSWCVYFNVGLTYLFFCSSDTGC